MGIINYGKHFKECPEDPCLRGSGSDLVHNIHLLVCVPTLLVWEPFRPSESTIVYNSSLLRYLNYTLPHDDFLVRSWLFARQFKARKRRRRPCSYERAEIILDGALLEKQTIWFPWDILAWWQLGDHTNSWGNETREGDRDAHAY